VNPSLSLLLTPLGLALSFVWNFAVLAAALVTVRLVLAFSVPRTALAALLLTVADLPATALYLAVADLAGDAASFQTRLAWLPLPMALLGALGFLLARTLLGVKRLRGAVFTGLSVALLAPPWVGLLFG
jgi:hypothetical protein